MSATVEAVAADDRYRIDAPQVISETIDGEAVMINLPTGNYYSLNDAGGEVWTLIERAASVEEMVATLAGRYEGAREEIERSVSELIDRLLGEELIVPLEAGEARGSAPGPMAGDPPAPSAPRRPFQAPTLEKFTDMHDLILLDPVHEVDAKGWPHLPPDAGAAR